MHIHNKHRGKPISTHTYVCMCTYTYVYVHAYGDAHIKKHTLLWRMVAPYIQTKTQTSACRPVRMVHNSTRKNNMYAIL